MKELIEGIVIKETPYSETSKIIQILTSEGIISLMAKGARGLKSNLRVGTTKLIKGVFCINRKLDKLSLLSGVDIQNEFRNIRKDIRKISYATFLLELSEQVMRQNNNPEIYTLLISSLEKLEEGFDASTITSILELKYLDYLGVMPVIDMCSVCGSKTGIATLSSSRGGYVCKNCLRNENIVSEKTIKLIRMFYYVDISKISSLEISNQSKKEISDFLDDYYDRYTGLYLKSKSLLKNLNKVG